MSNLLADGLLFLTKQLQAYASWQVTYARGYDSVSVQAMLGNKLLKIDDGMGGFKIEWTDLDFLIAADSGFTFGDGLIIPARGDQVYLTYGTQVQTFEVFPFGNEPPWRWADPHQSMFRIHTKYINMEQLA